MDPIGISRTALNDWLNLLQGPAEPPFAQKTDFVDPWRHLFQLIILVLIMLTTVLTFSYLGLKASVKEEIVTAFVANTAAQTRYTIIIILIGALFAILYALMIAPLFKLRVSVPQAFFTFLFVLLPWLPVVTLVWVLGYVIPEVPLVPLFIPLFIFVLFPIFIVMKTGNALCMITGSDKRRCVASVAVPFVLLFTLTIWIALRSQPIEETPPEQAVQEAQ
jgi:hypothetical protein